MPLFEALGLRKRFYGLEVLQGVDISVDSGEIVGLIGPNGSGKTTLFNCVTGLNPASQGTVSFAGREITRSKPFEIALAGLARTFQMVQVYPALSVTDNLLIAAQEHQERGLTRRLLRTKGVRANEAQASERAHQLLTDFGLLRLAAEPAGTLSYGQRKLVEFASVLMPDPRLILLDEPAAAVNPTMIEKMKEHVRRLNALGKTFLVVEHNMDVVMDICHRVVVLDHGVKIAEGRPAEVQQDAQVLEAYFGR